ncbi:MAG TPA: amidase [Alphaproteobacteria bacterium]|jgi:amidase|nr:amidase [Alphaproteobacteria bacterium]
MSDWSYKTAGELSAALAARQMSAVELTQDAIARIEAHDGAVNAVCVRDFDRALAAARSADAMLAAGQRKALLGIPMTVKESFNIAGLPTTWGFPPMKDFVAPEDSLAVTRVKEAGAVVLGKTNVPLGLGDFQSYNDIYGTTGNPWDLGRTPGGSSGGSSAALAAGYGPLSLGSDIGGSLRAPAHFCGVYAHKPSLGLVPARGHTPPGAPALPRESDLAVVGPMARCAADLSLLLDIIAGPDPLDAGIAYRLELPLARHTALKDFRVLVLDAHPLLPSAGSVRTAIAELAKGLAASGASVAYESPLLPDLSETGRLYLRLLRAFLGFTVSPEVYERFRAGAAGLSPENTSTEAENLRGWAASHRDWLIDDARRLRLKAQWAAFFGAFDAVICPVMPTPAFSHDHSGRTDERRIAIDGVDHPYIDQLIWAGVATAPGLPATAVPLGLSPEGLPIGAQIIGPWLEDRTPLALAALIEREFGGFTLPPGYG